MNELRTEIRKLMNAASSGCEPVEATPPFGFAARVVARARLTETPPIPSLQRAFSIVSWTAAVIIASSSVILFQHHRAADPASQIVTAAQLFTETLTP